MTQPFRTHHLLQIFEHFSKQTLPLDLFLNHYYRTHKALGSKDRAFINETSFALIRWKGLIDASSRSPLSWEQRIELFLNKSIDELRALTDIAPHDQVSFPKWLYERIVKQLGQETGEEICRILNQKAPPTLRTNLIKTDREALFKTLQKYGPVEVTSLSPYGLIFKEKMNYFEIPEFTLGHFEVQDEGSQLLADLIQPRPQDHVLDFCAGSGGKTLAFAHKMKGKGQLYLHDIRPQALEQAKKRLKKAGIQNAQIILADDIRLKKLKKKMDWVFVDAPCSGTGTFRRNPDMKWKLSEEMLQKLIGQQRSIFEQALSFLAPDGAIIYGTCSILAEENEEQTDHFIKTYSLKMEGEPLKILPYENGPDGFYGVVLRRGLK